MTGGLDAVAQTELPGWLVRGMADLFPAGEGAAASDADQALAARLQEAEAAGRPLRIKLGIGFIGSLEFVVFITDSRIPCAKVTPRIC